MLHPSGIDEEPAPSQAALAHITSHKHVKVWIQPEKMWIGNWGKTRTREPVKRAVCNRKKILLPTHTHSHIWLKHLDAVGRIPHWCVRSVSVTTLRETLWTRGCRDFPSLSFFLTSHPDFSVGILLAEFFSFNLLNIVNYTAATWTQMSPYLSTRFCFTILPTLSR